MDMDSKFQCDQFLVVCMFYSFSSNSFNFLSFDYVINFSLPALLRAENQKKGCDDLPAICLCSCLNYN